RHTRSKRDWSSDVCSSDLRRGEIMADDTPKQTLNIRSPALKARGNSESLTNAVNAKLLHKETFDEAWERIMAMKNSDADTRRLYEVKNAMEYGHINRESENT